MTISPEAQAVEERVRELYTSDHPDRDPWATWMWQNHVLWVADRAATIANQKGADVSVARVAALLHDVADSVMNRFNLEHEQKSLAMAEEILTEAGYEEQKIRLICDDMLAKHSCRGDVRPQSLEGQVMATADALGHIETSFFTHAFWWRGTNGDDYQKVMEWAGNKLEKDFHNKIFFDDIKESARPVYEALRALFTE